MAVMISPAIPKFQPARDRHDYGVWWIDLKSRECCRERRCNWWCSHPPRMAFGRILHFRVMAKPRVSGLKIQWRSSRGSRDDPAYIGVRHYGGPGLRRLGIRRVSGARSPASVHLAKWTLHFPKAPRWSIRFTKFDEGQRPPSPSCTESCVLRWQTVADFLLD